MQLPNLYRHQNKMLYTKLQAERREKGKQEERLVALQQELDTNRVYCTSVFSQMSKSNELLKTVLRSRGEKSENPLNQPGSPTEWLRSLKEQYSPDKEVLSDSDKTQFSTFISGITDLILASPSSGKMEEGQRLAELEVTRLRGISDAKTNLEVELHSQKEENKELTSRVQKLQEEVVSLQSIANRSLPYIIFENKEFKSAGVGEHKHTCNTCAIEFDDVQKEDVKMEEPEKKEDEEPQDSSSYQKINEALVKEVSLLRAEIEVSQVSLNKSETFKVLINQSRDLLTSYNELQEANIVLKSEIASQKS